jgi:hypothetical protein
MNELTTAAPGRALQDIPIGGPAPMPRILIPDEVIDNALRIARIAVGSGLMKATDGDAVAIATMIILKGRDLDMSPTTALDSIALINGRTCVWGKAVPALVRSRGHRIREWETGTRMADDWTFYCEITRGDTGEIVTRSFSVTDAKQAQLWNQEPILKKRGRDGPYEKPNDSPWFRYPQRMLPARARGYAAADGASEALLGMYTVEEMQDVARVEGEMEEIRGTLVTAPPPPPLLDQEQAQDQNDENPAVDAAGPQPAEVDRPGDSVSDTAPETPADQAEETLGAVEVAAVACAGAMSQAKTVDRLDKLMDAFNAKYDGEITIKISTQLEMIYNQNKDRIENPK